MEEVDIKSTALKHHFDNGYGFSGWELNENNNLGNVILAKNKNFAIAIYHRLTEGSSHLPQDSVGFFITKNDLQFAIADGVSIVNNTIHNKSGLLSYKLVNSLPINPNNSLDNYISKISSDFLKTGGIGASTFVYGRLKKNMNKFILNLLLVANPSDTGLNKIFIDNNKEIEVINTSYGFIPNNFSPENLSFELNGQFKLAFSSDGIHLNDDKLLLLIELVKSESDVRKISSFIEANSNRNKDDQSLVIITAR